MFKILVVVNKINTIRVTSHIIEFQSKQEADKAIDNLRKACDYIFDYRVTKLY